MRDSYEARLARVFVSERDRFEGKPLYEAIVERCREMKVAGATVVRGVEGYGESGEVHRGHLGWHDQPVVITVVDREEKVRELMGVVEGMMGTGVMAVSEVRVVRVEKGEKGRKL